MKELILPPSLMLVLLVIGFLWSRRHRDTGWWVGLSGVVMLYVFSTPVVSYGLISSRETYPLLKDEQLVPPQAQAIVILSAEGHLMPELGGWVPGPMTMTRLRYGVRLGRMTGLPILVSGGLGTDVIPPLAEQMHGSLVHEFGLTKVWTETQSKTTWENALYSAAILRAHGVTRIYLVTHAWHMPRAVRSFEALGITVIPAPTNKHQFTFKWDTFLPLLAALNDSYLALYESIGYGIYTLRHFP